MLLLRCTGSFTADMTLCEVARTSQYFDCPCCRPYAEKYAESQEAFFEDYVKAHLKLSELGVQWDPEPIEFDM